MEDTLSIHYSTAYSKQFEWTIKNLATHSYGILTSKEFLMGEHYFGNIRNSCHKKLRWTIKLILEKNKAIQIYLILIKDRNFGSEEIPIKCAFQVFHEKVTTNTIFEFSYRDPYLSSRPLEGITIKQEDLKNSDFKIAVSWIKGYGTPENEFIETNHTTLNFSVPKPKQVLANDFKNLLLNKEFSDLILKSKNKEFHVHKNILAARSPYFMAALKSNMKEKQENIISLPEEDNIIEELINYIYTGDIKPEIVETSAKELLIAADKYQVEELKNVCIYHLYNNQITIENAIELLLFAKNYNCKDFEVKIIKFIIFHNKEISKLDSFNSLRTGDPRLALFLECLG